MVKVDQHLVKSMKERMLAEPEKYMEDFVYLTYDYAFFAAEQERYEEAADLLKESLNALIQLKSLVPDIELDTDELQDMALGYHDLMIEMVEERYYDLAEEVRGWIRIMLDTYGIKLKNK